MSRRNRNAEGTPNENAGTGVASEPDIATTILDPEEAGVETQPAPVTLPHFYMTVDGMFWYRNAAAQLLDGLPTDRPSHYVEVGVFKGQSLAWLGIEIANRGLPTTLHAVDTFEGWDGVLQGARLRAEFDKNIAPVAAALGDRLQVHPVSSVAASQRFTDGTVDVVWLDADHSYEAVRSDIRAWLPKLRPGGVIGGDDWDWVKGGVAKAVTEAFPGRYTLGAGSQNGQPWQWWMVKVEE